MTEEINEEWFLDQLNSHGEDAGSDYNDGDDVRGWLGWSVAVENRILTIYLAVDKDDERTPKELRFKLVPLDS